MEWQGFVALMVVGDMVGSCFWLVFEPPVCEPGANVGVCGVDGCR